MTANVTISERAARRIGEILHSEGSGAMLRISVEKVVDATISCLKVSA